MNNNENIKIDSGCGERPILTAFQRRLSRIVRKFKSLIRRFYLYLKKNKYRRAGKLSLKELTEFKNGNYADYIKAQLNRTLTKVGKDASFRYDEVIKAFFKVSSNHRGRVLCVGCRNTYELDAFEKAGFEKVQGIDLVSTDPRITVMDMGNMKFSDNTFDLLYSGDSLEHSYEISRAASEFCRVVRSGGHIAVEVPINYKPNQVDRWDVKNLEGLLAFFRPHTKEVLPLWQEVSPERLKVIFEIVK